MKHGKGKYTSGTGAQYHGQFASDEMDGHGQYTFTDGRTYLGEWQKGHMSGKATMKWLNGSKYEGQYKDDTKHGEGTFWWPDGRIYKGQWLKGKAHGNGVSISPDGKAMSGKWEHGERLDAQKTAEGKRGDKGQQHSGNPSSPALEPARGATKASAALRQLQTGSFRQQFTVKLQKTPRISKLGVDVDIGVKHLTVERIQDEGLFAEWNRARPDQAVVPGDMLIEVNGTTGGDKMACVCKDAKELTITVLRDA